jgi:hypothetical protein
MWKTACRVDRILFGESTVSVKPRQHVMRLYWPKQEALDGVWKPAPVIRVE